MLNRYTDPAGWDALLPVGKAEAPPEPPRESPPAQPAQPESKPSAFSALGQLLDGRLRGLSTETLVLVVLVYFLVADRDEEDDKVSDTLLIIGALLLFGL